jgi:hypothetical protein
VLRAHPVPRVGALARAAAGHGGTANGATLYVAALGSDKVGAGDCELVAKAQLLSGEAGFRYAGAGQFNSDRRAAPPITDAALRAKATQFGRPVTYTCVPLGSGERIGVDRDSDGFWDGDERAAGTDPAAPASTP